MALISMAVYCTEENKKDELLKRTLIIIVWYGRFLISIVWLLSVNAKTDTTVQTLQHFWDIIDKVIVNGFKHRNRKY